MKIGDRGKTVGKDWLGWLNWLFYLLCLLRSLGSLSFFIRRSMLDVQCSMFIFSVPWPLEPFYQFKHT